MQIASNFRTILSLLLILSSGVLIAQTDTTDSDIGTQKLIIIRPYSPTVSDAVKVRQMPPKQKDTAIAEKKRINYNITSFPVASTFTPEKGKASGVINPKAGSYYDNYAALGIGNYTDIFAEFYSNIELSKTQNLVIGFRHNSSQGGINKAILDDKYYDTKLNLGYFQETENMYWDVKMGFQHQLYNWYGIFDNIFTPEQIKSIDPKHSYVGIGLGGDIKMKHGYFNKMGLTYQHFGDNFSNSENRIKLVPKFKFPLETGTFNAAILVDYLAGSFKEADPTKKYSFLNLGIEPSYAVTADKLHLNIGAQVVYSNDTEHKESKVYVYPDIKANYSIVDGYFSVYAWLLGGLEQNSYASLTQNNPYLTPDLLIHPTNKQYELSLGGKGKFTDEINYDVRASYGSEQNKALYNINTGSFNNDRHDYDYNNSFRVLYDNVKIFTLYGKIGVSLSEDFDVAASASIHKYSTDVQKEAWNLPQLEANINADYKINDKWSAGLDLFYVGQRKDKMLVAPGNTNPYETVKVKGFVDAGLRVAYQFNDQFGIFVRGDNLFNNDYDRWYHYPVQGIQGMLGVSYQF